MKSLRVLHKKDSKNGRPIIPENHDHTICGDDGKYESWDNYILDCDIVRILRMLYGRQPDHRFAQEILTNPDLNYYFTPPYSMTARELGYAGIINDEGPLEEDEDYSN